MFRVPERYRVRNGALGSDPEDGNNGAFSIPSPDAKLRFYVIASDGEGWEHVSISIRDKQRCPRWEEMCYIKRLFWDDEDCVVQFHPPRSEYVNRHPFTLHLWRPTSADLPRPCTALV